MMFPCGAVDFCTSGKDGGVFSSLLLSRVHEAQGTVEVFVIAPLDEAVGPCAGPVRPARMPSRRSGGMGFMGLGLISRSSSTPDLDSQMRSMDNYPDTLVRVC
jgi:hypothetical protein